MTEASEILERLCAIIDKEGRGAAWQEKRTVRGKSWTRTIRSMDAVRSAAGILTAINSGRSPSSSQIRRARFILDIAEWHEGGAQDELTLDIWSTAGAGRISARSAQEDRRAMSQKKPQNQKAGIPQVKPDRG